MLFILNGWELLTIAAGAFSARLLFVAVYIVPCLLLVSICVVGTGIERVLRLTISDESVVRSTASIEPGLHIVVGASIGHVCTVRLTLIATRAFSAPQLTLSLGCILWEPVSHVFTAHVSNEGVVRPTASAEPGRHIGGRNQYPTCLLLFAIVAQSVVSTTAIGSLALLPGRHIGGRNQYPTCLLLLAIVAQRVVSTTAIVSPALLPALLPAPLPAPLPV